jgi:hypothetical protein
VSRRADHQTFAKIVFKPLFVFRSETSWDVKRHTEYRLNPGVGEPGDAVRSRFFVQVDASGRTNEGFRIPVFGGIVVMDIWASDLFGDDDLRQYRFALEAEAAQIEIRPNTTSSKWEDVEDMLARGLLIAHKGAGSEDFSQEARRTLHAKRTENPEMGAALRWSVQAPDDQRLTLVLQGLPRPASFLRRDGRLTADTCCGVELARVRLETHFESQGAYRGPQPVLFSRHPEQTKEGLFDHPEAVLDGKLHSHISDFEYYETGF